MLKHININILAHIQPVIRQLHPYRAILSGENQVTDTDFSPSEINHLLPDNKALPSYDEITQSSSHSANSRSFFRNVFGLRMPTQQNNEVTMLFSKTVRRLLWKKLNSKGPKQNIRQWIFFFKTCVLKSRNMQ